MGSLHIARMSLRPLYGHAALRHRLTSAASDDRLPASLLLQGRRGVGKQRLALWLGQYLLCDRALADRLPEPCGSCPQCRYAERVVHPDLHWFFPRPRLKDGDASPDEIKADYDDVIRERMEAEGLWAPSLGTEGLHVRTMRALVHQSTRRPAMAQRAVFVVGDAERMITQLGGDHGANAFLKLLEEPPPSTTLILTTSEPGNLLPTITSRVVAIRVLPLGQQDMEAFLDDAAVARKLSRVPRADALARMNGAPGELFGADSMTVALSAAQRMLDAALEPSTPNGSAERIKVAARQGVAGARGTFTDILEALTHLLHRRVKELVSIGRDVDARRTASALMLVEHTKAKAQGNLSPQLLSAALLTSLHRTLRP